MTIGSKTAALLAGAALALAGCAETSGNSTSTRGTTVSQMRVDDSFGDWGIIWSGGGSGRYEARVKLVDIDGRIGLCGVGWLSSQTYAAANRQSLRTKFLTYEGRPILRDFSFFASVESEPALDSAVANCAVTTMRTAEDTGGEFDIGGNRSRFSAR